MELWQYYRILRKRRWLIVIGSLICACLIGAAAYLIPNGSMATTTVMEKMPDMQNDVTIFGGPIIQVDPKLVLADLMQLAMSDSVKTKALEDMQNHNVRLEKDDPSIIMKTLDVEPVLDTMVLAISVTASNESDAKTVISFVKAAFLDRFNQMNNAGATDTRQFIEGELPKAKASLDAVGDELRQYKEQSGAVNLPNQENSMVALLSQLQTYQAQYQVQAGQANAKLKGLGAQLNKFPETRQSMVTMDSNPVWQQLQFELAKEQIDLQKHLKDETPQHPDVIALQSQIDETKKELKDAGATIIGSRSVAVNPIRDNLIQEYSTSLAEAASANAALDASQKVVAGVQPALLALPAKEAKLAELTAEQDAAKNTYMLLKQKYDEARIKEKESTSVTSLEVIDDGLVGPGDPKRMLKAVLAVALSVILCCGTAFLLNYLDNSVKTPAEAEELLKLPVSAAVPMARLHSLAEAKALPSVSNPYQMLSANLWIRSAEMETRTILVASAEPNMGRSTTAANLAITLARDGARVILVDADFRQPVLHKIFKVDNEKGLSNILAGQLAVRDALRTTSIPDLLLISSGPLPANPIRPLRSPEMASFVAEINELADFVIFDSPAGIAFADATLLASLVKNVVLVHAAGSVPRGSEPEFRSRLEQVQANFVGAVLNMVKPEDSHGYYHFRSAYGELLKDGKHMAALPGSATGSTHGDAGANK